MANFIKKIGKLSVKIIARTVIALFCFYLFIAWVFIPLGLPLLAKWQGTKILGHQVILGGAGFNPFTLSFTLKNLRILDKDKKPMVGFKKFWLNVSFLKLLAKEYNVESVGLEGLEVNVVLLPGSQVNLLSLAPKQAQPSGVPAQPAAGQPAPASPANPATSVASRKTPAASASQPLPNVVVKEIVLKDGAISFSDQDIAPGFTSRLSAMQMLVTGISTKPDCQVKMTFSSDLDQKGKISTEALVKPFVQPLDMEATFSLNDYAMRALTPYVGKYTGRAVKEGGKLDVKVSYRIEENKLKARHKVLIQSFGFGEKVESKDALSLPFGLAVALLEDPQGKIDISLPVNGDINDPKFEYFHLLGQVARNFFMKLVTAPFKMLLAMVPGAGETGTEEMGSVSFAPGLSILSDQEKEKLGLLAKIMKERPKLSLEINGSYDPAVDWKVIKTKAFEDEFEAKRKNSDFPDFRLYEDMYKYEFGTRNFWNLNRQFTKDKVTDKPGLVAEMKRLVIEKGGPQKPALEKLGLARAQAVYDTLIAVGFDSARVKIGACRQTEAAMGAVPMEFTLTVFGETKPGEEKPAEKSKKKGG